MKPYRPSREKVWRDWLRQKRFAASRRGGGCRIPDNSAPWSAEPPKNVAEAIAISDQIERLREKCEQLKNS